MVHTIADDFAREVARLGAIEVQDRDWRRSLDTYVARVDETGAPLKGRSLTMADRKRDGLARLSRHDVRVAPWAGTTQGVIKAVNTYEHHESIVRGATRPERNTHLRTVTGHFARLDRRTYAVLASVLD